MHQSDVAGFLILVVPNFFDLHSAAAVPRWAVDTSSMGAAKVMPEGVPPFLDLVATLLTGGCRKHVDERPSYCMGWRRSGLAMSGCCGVLNYWCSQHIFLA